ncbi:MAG TPA: Calx-beta domain-containing protein, partial [Candidatus Dormibacteraeota bacterium]|nr:Calx-beta domain-containing protein [Candidatus Dormibacteraeota bacterium]
MEENGGNLIIGNFIGVDDTGTNIAGNGLGILIGPNCPLNTIGGRDPASRNVISGNRTGGIQISAAASGNVIQGNYIGTDRSGSVSCANGFAGIVVSNCVRNTVGGVRAGDGNLLSGNSGSGLALLNGAAENQVQGNIIGLTQSGEVALPNARHGIELQEAWDNTLGGPQPGAANVISGNGESGVRLSGSDSQRNVIQGNRIGLNATGTAALGNGRFGVEIQDGQSITIGGVEPGSGNVISGNAWSGVWLSGQGHVVQGNQIGTDLSGTRAIPNSTGSDGGSGLHIQGAEHTIGGSVAGRNLISGNALHGVTLAGSNVVVQGNFIGTDRSGGHRLGNGAAGIQLVQAAANNTIGGAGLDERNVISGNEAEGVRLEGPQVELNAVQGNLIGLAADGRTALGNGSYGLTVANGHDNLIGGSDPEQGNVIAANRAGGVRMEGEADGLIVQGNWIGTDETGAMPQPNAGPGIWIESPARNSLIGGRTPGTGNRIAFNEADGVLIRGESAVGHTIVGNSLEANWGLAINLEWNGVAPGPVTPNDALDSDLGPNGLQNFPVITNITFNAGVTAVRGLLASAPEHDYAIDVYHSAAADPSGFGEGAVYAGEVVVTTDRQGLAGFAFFMVGEVADRRFSVTATDLDTDSTSEFGLAFPNHDALPQLTIADLTVSEEDQRNGLAVFTVRLSEPTNRRVSVTCQTADGTALAGLDYVATNRILTFTPGEASAILAVVLLADSAVEPE